MLGVLVFLTIPIVQAQDRLPYLIVEIEDEHGAPLKNAKIQVIKNGRLVTEEFTDFRGRRIIVGLDIGHHLVTIQHGQKTQDVKLCIIPDYNSIYLEMGQEQLPTIIQETKPVLIMDAYGGGNYWGPYDISYNVCCPGRGPIQKAYNSNVIGGLWLPDTRAPTFRNMMNVQPND